MIRLNSAEAIKDSQSTALRPGSLAVIEDPSAFAEGKLLDACVRIAKTGARCLIKTNFDIDGDNPHRDFCGEMRFSARHLYSQILEDDGVSWTPRWGLHRSSTVPTLFADDSPTFDLGSLDEVVPDLGLDVLAIMDLSSILADEPDKVTGEFHRMPPASLIPRLDELAGKLNVAIVANLT